MRRFLVLIFLGLTVASPALAQSQPNDDNQPQNQARSENGYSLSPQKYQQAVEFSRTVYKLHFVSVAYTLISIVGLLWFGISSRFRDWAEAVSRRRLIQAAIFVPLLLLSIQVIKLPLSAYYHRLSVHYGLSIQSWGSWFLDWTKSALVQCVIAVVLVTVLYAVIRRSARRWWLYFGVASIPLLIFVVFIAPIVIDPLFDRFEPLQKANQALADQIEKVVQHAGLGIPPERLFEMKASEKVNEVNAYVTGFGSSKRVVVWDTTIEKLGLDETLFVVGHEIGHYVLGHIAKGIALGSAAIIAALFVVQFLTNWALARCPSRLRIRGMDDWASLPVILLFFYLLTFVGEPVANTYSRQVEHEADVYGLEVIRGLVSDPSDVAAKAFQVLGEIDLADPAPSAFIKFWLYDHPPLAERIKFAREHK